MVPSMLKHKGECVEEEFSAGGVDVQPSRMGNEICARSRAIVDLPPVDRHVSPTLVVVCVDRYTIRVADEGLIGIFLRLCPAHVRSRKVKILYAAGAEMVVASKLGRSLFMAEKRDGKTCQEPNKM